MSLFSRFLGMERRGATTTTTSDPFLGEFLGQRSGAGGYVDATRASGLAVAHACISAISQNLSSVPLNLYQWQEEGGRKKADGLPLHGVLHDAFNPQMTAFEGREFLIASLLISGNAYAKIETNQRGQVIALYPLNAANVAVERAQGGGHRYRVSDARGGVTILLADEMLHLRYRIGPDGITGLSPIQIARETFNLALCQQDQAQKQAGKAFRPEGALVFPEKLSGERKNEALALLAAKIESNSGTSGTLVLDGGLDWKPFAHTSKDAEFLESRKLTQMDIARIYGVPPTVVGITDNATYSNVDGESRALVMRCLAPMAKRIEQAMNAALLTAEGRKRYFVEHDLAGLLRGDQQARYEAYRMGREYGWLSPNEIRAWENLPKIEHGDEYLSPLNMAPLGQRDGGSNG